MQYKNANYAAFSNWNLSSNRAMSVENILQLATCNLQVVGMTDRAPYDVKNPQAASNRRIELLVLTGRPSSRKG
jgi:chemotaxis protein MotB